MKCYSIILALLLFVTGCNMRMVERKDYTKDGSVSSKTTYMQLNVFAWFALSDAKLKSEEGSLELSSSLDEGRVDVEAIRASAPVFFQLFTQWLSANPALMEKELLQ